MAFRLSIPWVKVEYQLTSSLFFRTVAQYQVLRRDSVRDWRTALPIIGIDPAQAANASLTALRHDWLLSYQPSADKVVFMGYGGNLGPQQLNEIRNLRRTRDRFFLKVSYPFRPGRRSPTA